jgi:hypothetical protein
MPNNKKIKIYGELNTGTNYLAQLLFYNYNVDIFKGISPGLLAND